MEKQEMKRVLAGLSLVTLLAAVGGCACPGKGGASGCPKGAKDAAPQAQPAQPAPAGGMSGCGGAMGCGGTKK